MKKEIVILTVVYFVFLSVVTFAYQRNKVSTESNERSAATVENIQGLNVFICARPVSLDAMVYLGTIKAPGITDPDFHLLVPKMIKRAQKDYPNGQALVFKNNNILEADVYQYK